MWRSVLIKSSFRNMLQMLNTISFTKHLFISFFIRMVIIGFGAWMDRVSEVPYTDIDYRVVNDGARHILNERSPYERHTYRYSPLLAIALIPNHLVHECWGKILFSLFDLAVGGLINVIVLNGYQNIWNENVSFVKTRLMEKSRTKRVPTTLMDTELKLPKKYEDYAKWASLIWLYNPLAIVISTRGNGDSITSALVLLTVYFLLDSHQTLTQFFLAGLVHGVAIHFRLYPIGFSLAYYLYAAGNHRRNIIQLLLMPTKRQLILIAGTICSLFSLTHWFYQQYGHQFLHESYIHHLKRKDIRHNFSLYFYMQYLSADEIIISLIEKLFTFTPQLLILLALANHFGKHSRTLPFCIFAQSFTMVTFNPVITSQYFIWFLSLLPICVQNLTRIGGRTALAYSMLWMLAQGAWLGPAYLLEFKGWNMFGLIWMQGIMFFCVNMFLLHRFIMNFNVISDLRQKQF